MSDRIEKIIISIGSLQSGGSERVACEIAAMYCDHFDEVIVLTWLDQPVFYQVDNRIRLVCAEQECGAKGRFRQALWMRKFVRMEHPKVFLSFLMPFNMLSIVALAFTKTKIVVCERQDPSRVKNSLLRGLRNMLYCFSYRIEVQTTVGKNYFSPKLQTKTFVIPNPNHITIEQRHQSLETPLKNRLVTIGRLIPIKNHSLLIEAFVIVHKQHPDYILDIYGEGGLRPSLQEQINNASLQDYIHLYGRTKDICSSLASAKIFVLSSNVEGMPNALMEAMAIGIPCVATDVSGVRDIITDDDNGFVVPVEDKEALAEKIIQLIESEKLQKKFSNNSISVFKKFDKEKIFKQWIDLVAF